MAAVTHKITYKQNAMKNFLLACLFLIAPFAFAQAPVITGDLLLCPNTNGTATITGSTTYTTYQWYYKYWFLNDEYAAIEGATSSSFTYDWMTYDQALLKVVVTLNGQTYESNAIQIDSYAWVGLTVMHSTNDAVSEDGNGGFLLCEGGAITNSIGSPYTNVQWFKDGTAIAGATAQTYVITAPGVYHASAAPGFCPASVSFTLPITVANNPNCGTPPEVVAPVIAGENLMMCPFTNSVASITNNQTYETYQWYFKYWFLDDDFAPIEGATSPSFTYDWYTYDQAILKLVVTQDGETYESNTIQIDSYNWASLTFLMEFSEGVVADDATFSYLICEGDTITNTLNSPYDSNIQWYKDGEPIAGANEVVYVITEPGAYHVVAAPAVCSDATSSTAGNEVIVSWKADCTAGVNNPDSNKDFVLYPNPATNVVNIQLPANAAFEAYSVYDVTGKQLINGSVNATQTTIDVSSLAAGSYIIKLNGGQAQATQMFVKQ